MAGHFFKKWPHRVVLGGGPWGNRPSKGPIFGGGVLLGGVSWGPFLGVSQEGSFFGVPGGEGVWGP